MKKETVINCVAVVLLLATFISCLCGVGNIVFAETKQFIDEICEYLTQTDSPNGISMFTETI